MLPQIRNALENIYISPLEICNLNCRHCYTNKTKNILTNDQILNFVNKYNHHLKQQGLSLKSILFCGGEVFTLKEFPHLVNKLLSQDIFISIITNGTIDCLDQIKDPQNCQLLVSLDGPQAIHDANRGPENFQKTINFIKSALQKKFPVEIMFLVTSKSYPYINKFKKYLYGQIEVSALPLPINYITYKSNIFRTNHPLTVQAKSEEPQLTAKQIINIKKHYPSIPAKNFGCFQLSLQSNGSIYGCCESPLALGKLSDPIKTTLQNFLNSLTSCTQCPISTLNPELISCSSSICNGCSHPDFLCGYKKELAQTNCQQVVQSLHL